MNLNQEVKKNDTAQFIDLKNSKISKAARILVFIIWMLGMAVILTSNAFQKNKWIEAVQGLTYEPVGFIPEPRTVPILMYHHFDCEVCNDFVVTPEKLKNDLEEIAASGYTAIFFDDLYKHLIGEIKIPEKSVIISVDDGYYSSYKYLYPLLEELNMKASIAIIGWSAGRDEYLRSGKKITPHFNLGQAKEMVDSGHVEIQNHTYDLHTHQESSDGYQNEVNVGMLPLEGETKQNYAARLQNDLDQFNDVMISNQIRVPEFMVYPYGKYNELTEEILKEIFTGTVTTRKGIRRFKNLDDCREIPRINIDQNTSVSKMLEQISLLGDLISE